jgi:hypothetical protein
MINYVPAILLISVLVSSAYSMGNTLNGEIGINAQGFAANHHTYGKSSKIIPIIRYDRSFNRKIKASLGMAFYHQQFGWYDNFIVRQILFPIRIYYEFGRRNNLFETGLGVMPGYSWSIDPRVEPRNPYLFYPEIITGYRFDPTGTGIVFRCGVSHEIEYFSTLVYNPCPYISLGWEVSEAK